MYMYHVSCMFRRSWLFQARGGTRVQFISLFSTVRRDGPTRALGVGVEHTLHASAAVAPSTGGASPSGATGTGPRLVRGPWPNRIRTCPRPARSLARTAASSRLSWRAVTWHHHIHTMSHLIRGSASCSYEKKGAGREPGREKLARERAWRASWSSGSRSCSLTSSCRARAHRPSAAASSLTTSCSGPPPPRTRYGVPPSSSWSCTCVQLSPGAETWEQTGGTHNCLIASVSWHKCDISRRRLQVFSSPMPSFFLSPKLPSPSRRLW